MAVQLFLHRCNQTSRCNEYKVKALERRGGAAEGLVRSRTGWRSVGLSCVPEGTDRVPACISEKASRRLSGRCRGSRAGGAARRAQPEAHVRFQAAADRLGSRDREVQARRFLPPAREPRRIDRIVGRDGARIPVKYGKRGHRHASRSCEAPRSAAGPATASDRAREAAGTVGCRSRAHNGHVRVRNQGGGASRSQGTRGQDEKRRMKTEDLVTMLATGEATVEENAAARRYSTAIGWGAFGATLLMALVLGVRADLAAAAGLPMFWVKILFSGALTMASIVIALRLSQPGARLVPGAVALGAPILGMWILAAVTLARAQPALWPELLFGQTWTSCPLLIAMLSIPMFVAALWAMKGLAPTRLRLAG